MKMIKILTCALTLGLSSFVNAQAADVNYTNAEVTKFTVKTSTFEPYSGTTIEANTVSVTIKKSDATTKVLEVTLCDQENLSPTYDATCIKNYEQYKLIVSTLLTAKSTSQKVTIYSRDIAYVGSILIGVALQ
jgi:hypothetical protein